MEQKMIMESKEDHFKAEIEKWCEARWTVVPGSQGIYANDWGAKYWVWMQDNRCYVSSHKDITLDILP